MGETITMADVLYVPVDDQGEPYRWTVEDEVAVDVFGDFWRARRSVEGKGRVYGLLRWRTCRNSCAASGAT
jgi:hypothetical protein